MINVDNTGETSYSPVSYGEELPQWFFDGGHIGISDPIGDTVLAYNQAVQRALVVYALGSDINASIVYEYYYLNANKDSKNRENQKSHWIAEFKASIDSISYTVEKVYRTKHRETIVSLKIEEKTEGNASVDLMGSFMYHYEYLNKKLAYGEKQILKASTTDTIQYFEWNSTIDNSKYLKTTISDEFKNTLKRYVISYSDAGTVNNEMLFSNTEFGLWNSYIDTFFQAISIFESKNVIVKNTTRQIKQEDNGLYKDKTQDISRLVMSTKISCSISELSMKDNNLYATWQIIEK